MLRRLAVAAALLLAACSRTTPEAENRTPKVLLIGVDGVRTDVLAEVPTPNLDALAREGTFTDRARTGFPSVSGPGWSSMLTGVWPEKHGVMDNEFVGKRYDLYPDFLTRVETLHPELATFAVADWLPLVEADDGDPTIGAAVDDRRVLDGYELGWAEGDSLSVEMAIEHLRTADPDALFVYLGNPDDTSHHFGSIGTEYREAIALADRHVGMLVAAVTARPAYAQEDSFRVPGTSATPGPPRVRAGGLADPVQHRSRTAFGRRSRGRHARGADHLLPGERPLGGPRCSRRPGVRRGRRGHRARAPRDPGRPHLGARRTGGRPRPLTAVHGNERGGR